jgi:hypothetical protein
MRVELTSHPEECRVDATVEGDHFTSYRWDDLDVLTKPVCYPVMAADGRAITRGYPVDPRQGERVDHPHHVGFSLTYGNVNGYDFWNNSGGDQEGMGRILHDQTERIESGDPAKLVATADWVDPQERRHLRENTTYRFYATGDRRVIDRITTLSADRDVDLGDDKEGLCAIRVRSGLEHPEAGDVSVVEDPSVGSTTEIDGRQGRSGVYHTSEGVEGTAAWGTRARWIRLTGNVEDAPVAVTLMDHPENTGHPAFWHARGYGLFSVNPLGWAAFTDDAQRLDYELNTGESTTLRYRLAVDVDPPTTDEIDERYQSFVQGQLHPSGCE